MTDVALAPPRAPHLVSFDVEYPERLSRLTTFFRLILAIPQLIVVYLLLIAFYILSFLAWFAILFTGRYPKGFFNFGAGVLRWNANVFAYLALLRDEYPPFSWEPAEYHLMLGIEHAERQSRFRLFVRWFSVWPNYLVLYFVQIAWLITLVVSWLAILITGKYPRGLFQFSVGVIRWHLRLYSYMFFLRDEYPPYSLKAEARPGNEVVSAVLGVPLAVGYAAILIIASFGSLWQRDNAIVVHVSYTSLLREEVRAPYESAAINNYGIHLQLDGASDPDTSHTSISSPPRKRFVSFRLTIGEYFGDPLSISEGDFSIKDELGQRRKPTLALINGLPLPRKLSANRSAIIELIFELDNGINPVELRYQADRIEYSPFAGDPNVRPISFRFTPP